MSSSNEQWFQYYNQTKLNNKWTWLIDGSYRRKDNFSELSQYLIRTGIGYSINKDVKINAGIAHFGFVSSEQLSKVEFRPYQEVIVKNKLKKISLNHRFRVEQRYFYPVINGDLQNLSTFNFRYRYALIASIPLFNFSKENPDKKLLLNIGDELFINSGKDIVYNIFDQNRILISPTIQFNKKLSIAITWNEIYATTTLANTYKKTHVLWIQIKHNLDLTSKKKNTLQSFNP